MDKAICDRSEHNRRSQRSHRSNNRRPLSNRGHNSSADENFLMPTFSAAISEGPVKLEMNQDERWGEDTTVVTGNTSEHSYSYDDSHRGAKRMPMHQQETTRPVVPMKLAHYTWLLVAVFICTVAFLSPILMVVLPKGAVVIPMWNESHWITGPCSIACEGKLIALSFRVVFLLIGMFAVFARRAVADMPRLFLSRAAMLSLIVFLTFAYWLFYGVRVVQKREEDYDAIVSFALNFLDCMLIVHYLALLLLELRHLRPEYKITIVRCPDGASATMTVGLLSIQRAAVQVLRHYYRQFPVYNPFLDKIPGSGSSRMKLKGNASQVSAGFKLYNIEGAPFSDGLADVDAQALMTAAARRRDTGHNERFYDEMDWQRRVSKRRSRLISATEEAFAHVKRLHDQKGPCVPMNAYEAAQAVFPALARPLQKYLRVTRQQPRHTAEQVVCHLAQCLTFSMSPRSFLQRFFSNSETFEASTVQTKWSILCSKFVSRSLEHGTVFQLRCHSVGTDSGVQLLCTSTRLPFLNLTEEVFNCKNTNFTLRLSSETSV